MKEYFVWLFKLITLMVVFVVILPLLLMLVGLVSQQGATTSIPGDSDKLVGVVELTGLISSSKDVIDELHKEIKNDKIKGIVLRIDSPGGAVGPSQEIFSAVRTLKEKKPIVVSMGSVAASGGLYSALGASKILCQPGTLTGSIGVILQVPNFAKLGQTIGVDVITIKSGELKDAGNSFREMTDVDRAYLQSMARTVHEQFIQAVADSRGIAIDEVRKFADGRALVGGEALERRVVDGYGDVYEAARAVFDVLGQPLAPGTYPRLYYSSDHLKALRSLFESVSQFTGFFSRAGVELRYQMY